MTGSKSIPAERLGTIYKVIQALLAERDADGEAVWTQKALAKRLGLAQSHISTIAREMPGVGVGGKTLVALHEMTGKSFDELLMAVPYSGQPLEASAPRPAPPDVQAIVKETVRETMGAVLLAVTERAELHRASGVAELPALAPDDVDFEDLRKHDRKKPRPPKRPHAKRRATGT